MVVILMGIWGLWHLDIWRVEMTKLRSPNLWTTEPEQGTEPNVLMTFKLVLSAATMYSSFMVLHLSLDHLQDDVWEDHYIDHEFRKIIFMQHFRELAQLVFQAERQKDCC